MNSIVALLLALDRASDTRKLHPLAMGERLETMNTPKKAYILQQVADILGTCRQTIYRRVIAGDIPCNGSLGPKLWRVPAKWVESYLSCQ